MKPLVISRFYKSEAWANARKIKILSVGGKCEKCGKIGKEVHHKKHLTIKNVADTDISLNQANLLLLCIDCHNKEHQRFHKQKKQKFDELGRLVM